MSFNANEYDKPIAGEDYNVEEVEDGPRPFRALLDTGLKRTSTGSKVFAALKVGHSCLYLGGKRIFLLILVNRQTASYCELL